MKKNIILGVAKDLIPEVPAQGEILRYAQDDKTKRTIT
jgi:hypothetical protein